MSLIERAAQKLSQLSGTQSNETSALAASAVESAQSRLQQTPVPDTRPTETSTATASVTQTPEAKPAVVESKGYGPQMLRPRGTRNRAGGAVDAGVATTNRVNLDLPRLAAAGFITPDAPRSQIASEFRLIKRPLIANVKGKTATPLARPNLIMVTSAVPGEGKSFTALNLALSIAMELDNTVLLVDGDVAQPSLSRMLDLPPMKGLIEVLSDSRLALQDVLLKTNVDKLTIMPSGSPHERNTELLASEAMNTLLDEIATRYPDRIVIFDSPPLLATTESPVLANHMGQILVVVESMKTTHGKMMKALSTIESCPVVMMLLNKSKTSDLGDYYGYYSY